MDLNYEEIGRNIRKHRIEQGMRQKEVADLVNVSEQHHIENAHTKLSLPTLVAIANVLGVDCNTLLGKNLSEANMSIAIQELERLMARMGSSKLRLCVELCRVLAEFDP